MGSSFGSHELKEFDVINVDVLYQVGAKRYSLYWNEIEHLRAIIAIEAIKRKDVEKLRKTIKRKFYYWLSTLIVFEATNAGYGDIVSNMDVDNEVMDVLRGGKAKGFQGALEFSSMYDWNLSFKENYNHNWSKFSCVWGFLAWVPYSSKMLRVMCTDCVGCSDLDVIIYKKSTGTFILNPIDLARKYIIEGNFEAGKSIIKKELLNMIYPDSLYCGDHVLAWIDDDDYEYIDLLIKRFGARCPGWLIDKHGLGRKQQIEEFGRILHKENEQTMHN